MKIYFLVFLIFLFCVRQIDAVSTIKINEFLIDPSQSVELYNNGSGEVDISHWYIDDNGGTTYFTIPNGTIIYPHSCRVFSGEFNLNKSSADIVRLFDATAPPTATSSALLDSFSYPSSPGVGISYMRNPDGADSWITGPSSLGKFNSTGDGCEIIPTTIPTPSPTITLTPTPTTPFPSPTSPISHPTSYENIFLSEAMVSPDSGLPEWIELYNNSNGEVNLSNWYIDDTENSGSLPKIFSIVIPAHGYGAFDLSTSMFNNSGDSVRLLDFNKQVKDSFEYSNSLPSKSLGRKSLESDEFCIQEPSKGSINIGCIEPTGSANTTSSTKSSTTITPTIIPTVIKKSITESIVSKVPASYLVADQSTPPQSIPIAERKGKVLAAFDDKEDINQNSPLTKSLSFSSFGFSLLSAVFLFIKLKLNL